MLQRSVLLNRAVCMCLGATIAALAGCAASPGSQAGEAPLQGSVRARLMVDEKAVPGARFRALQNPGGKFGEKEIHGEAGPDGVAHISLPPGLYYMTGSADTEGYFGYYGPNPVQVRPGDEMIISIRGLTVNRPPSVQPGDGWSAIAGTVMTEEGPLPDATVAFYLDSTGRFRGPGYVEVESDEEGRFEATLSPGRYYLVIRRRTAAGRFGPLGRGDYFGYYAYNPVTLHSGELLELQVGAVEVLQKAGWTAPSSLRTRVGGQILNTEGKPLSGYRAFLHYRREMLGRPAFASEPSGPDGSYTIWVDKEGTYFLGARGEIGKAREEGEMVGFYEGRPDHSVEVRLDGKEMTRLDVIVR